MDHLRGHFFAFLRALFTSVGAFLAMIHVMLAAFFTAATAGVGAEATEFTGQLRTS